MVCYLSNMQVVSFCVLSMYVPPYVTVVFAIFEQPEQTLASLVAFGDRWA